MCKIVNLTRNSKMSTHTFIDNFPEVILKICIFLCCLCGRCIFNKWTQQYFHSHMGLQKLASPIKCKCVSLPLEIVWAFGTASTKKTPQSVMTSFSISLSLPLNTQPWNPATLLQERPGHRRWAFQLISVSKPNHRSERAFT